ncbi:MAG: hotdog domain-containing protein [Gemmataceae bacterium]
MSEMYLAMQTIMMPRETNQLGSIFGGVILSYIDLAGAIGGRHAIGAAGGPLPHLVTVAINRVEFKQPVFVGDVVRLRTKPLRIGKTSVSMLVVVEAERGVELLQVTEAEVVYVGIDPATRRPVPLRPGADSE